MSILIALPRRLWLMLISVGPGIFAIGYTVGTGSVTTMVKAGSETGTLLLWHLLLCCLFSWVVMEAYGRYAVVTGETAIYSFKTKLKFGKILAIFTMSGIIIGQWSSYTGIVGICSNGIYETVRLFIPELPGTNYWVVLAIAVVILLFLYALIMVGRYSFFERVLVLLVTLMAICFLITMFIVIPSPKDITAGFIPRIPRIEGGGLLFAAFVGTTMAGPTFIIRPLTIKGHGWTRENIREQSRDALVSAVMIFVISASILVCAAGVLFPQGIVITRVLDMVGTLEPLVGKFAVALFMVGLVSAGLSSTFPIMMVAALLVADYRRGDLDTSSVLFRILAAVACLFGLIIPIMGAQPIIAQILTQVFNVFVLPVVVLGIIILVNRKEIMDNFRAGLLLNLGLAGALVFSIAVSYKGIVSLIIFF
jgi:manganese transport protein